MILVLLAAGLLQGLWPAVHALGSAKVPFLAAVVLFYAARHGAGAALAAAILAGIIQDSMSQIPMGYSALCFIVLGMTVWRIRDTLFGESLLTAVALGGLAGAFVPAALLVMMAGGDAFQPPPAAQVLARLGGSAALGLLVTPLVWGVARRVSRLVGLESEGRRDHDA